MTEIEKSYIAGIIDGEGLIIPSKKKRAELLLNKYKDLTPRNGRYSDKLLKAKFNFYKEFLSIE